MQRSPKFSLDLSPTLRETLKAEAATRGICMSELVRQILGESCPTEDAKLWKPTEKRVRILVKLPPEVDAAVRGRAAHEETDLASFVRARLIRALKQ